VHPVSTALFLVGYGLALPIGMRLGWVVRSQHRLALTGHQIGVGIAVVGWLLRGSIGLVIAHVAWLVAARIWFALGAAEEAA
jgi:hypothetical protein